MLICQQLRVAEEEAAHVLQCAHGEPAAILAGKLHRQCFQQGLSVPGAPFPALLGLHNLLADEPVGADMRRVDRPRGLGARRLPDHPDAVYVLHCFQKKSKSGIKTPKEDMDLIHARLKAAKLDFEAWQTKQGAR